MVTAFISHSSKDQAFARELADFLEQDDKINTWLDSHEINPGSNLVNKIEDGLDTDFLLLVLSPDSVASAWVKEEWTHAFFEQVRAGRTKLVSILYRDCAVPRLLRNKSFIDARTNQPEALRKIRSFLLGQGVEQLKVNHLPVRPPIFIGRQEELVEMRRRLGAAGAFVHIVEQPGQGKTTLALEFTHRYQRDFEAVYWLPCQRGSLASLSAELARLMGWKLEGDLDYILRELAFQCGGKRCLLVLDNVDDESTFSLVPGGVASVLVTTRRRDLPFLWEHEPLCLPLFSEEQCFEYFQKQLGPALVAKYERECKQLFDRVGNLPIAVSVSAALIKHDARYTISKLAQILPTDVTSLIREAIDALNPVPRKLLSAMSVCAPEGFSLDFAIDIAEMDLATAIDALQHVFARSLIEELDKDEQRYRLHALIIEALGGEYRSKHARTIQRRFENWEVNWRQCERDLADFWMALDWSLAGPENRQRELTTRGLAHHGYRLNERVGRLSEALQICDRMILVAKESTADGNLTAWLGNRALILRTMGRFEDALDTYKEQEATCLHLGKMRGLQASYRNQALILKRQGRLDEAFILLKKQEAICRESGNKDGLQRSYGNQALILKAWDRYEEAFSLLKEQETLCVQSGDKDSLQWCYRNQALVLLGLGLTEDATERLKKQTAICLEIDDKDSLQKSYGGQAIILRESNRLGEAFNLLKKQEELCLEVGNNDSLQETYGSQAGILQTWGRYDEALQLLAKQESICLKVGNREGLGFCYSAWGLLERARGDIEAGKHKLAAAIAIFRSLGMPRETRFLEKEMEGPNCGSAASV